MANLASISSTKLQTRRQELQNQRRLKFWQAIWRLMVVSSLAGGLFWVVTMPNWLIREGSQIEIEGNQYLSQDEIRSLLPLSYPKSIVKLQTHKLVEQLKSNAPIAEARVTRQLIPPTLTLELRERQPVAIALSPATGRKGQGTKMEEVGFLDEQGILVPRNFYANPEQDFELPKLKFIGFREQYRSYWSEIYPLINHSSVKVLTVDWRDPSNLILHTELGAVHLGSYSANFPQQLATLARMKQLPRRVEASRLVYIDLTNPAEPAVKLKPLKRES